ncbi:MAG: hypothetical protein U5O39_13500 [Gammaproteobacteria bacterium]|nr:hypothetical protein [Gammaproteobacteria bacterium]
MRSCGCGGQPVQVDVEEKITATYLAFSGFIEASPSAVFFMTSGGHRELSHGRAGPVQFAGGGTARTVAHRTLRLRAVSLDIANGWHVNAERIDDDDLVPARVDAGQANVVWPERDSVIREGEFAIDIEGDADSVAIDFSPVAAKLCLLPETLSFAVRR